MRPSPCLPSAARSTPATRIDAKRAMKDGPLPACALATLQIWGRALMGRCEFPMGRGDESTSSFAPGAHGRLQFFTKSFLGDGALTL